MNGINLCSGKMGESWDRFKKHGCSQSFPFYIIVNSFCVRLAFCEFSFPPFITFIIPWASCVCPSCCTPPHYVLGSSPAEPPTSWRAFFLPSPCLSRPVVRPMPNFQLFWGSVALLGRKLESILHGLLQIINGSATKPREFILPLMCA